MTNALICVPREVETFIRPEKMTELESLVNLTVRNDLERDEDIYSKILQELGTEIVITGWGTPMLSSKVLDENPQLKYMCNLTGTVRPILEREPLERGLIVTNWGTLIGPTVAEAALSGILTCLRRTIRVTREVHYDGGWRSPENNTVESLFYQKVGLHGFGVIAQELAKLLVPFKCGLSTYSPHAPDAALAEHGVLRADSLAQLYAENHIISVHASNTPENRHTVNADVLAGMHDGAVLVNTARGAIIDTEALIAELGKERIFASLDVYEEEPLAEDSPMRGMKNVHLTCHTGGPTPDRRVDFGDEAIANIRRYINGESLSNVVTVEKYDLIT